jgi:hypothetical protein
MKSQGIFGILFVIACMTVTADTPDTAAAFSIETYKPARYLVQSFTFSPSCSFSAVFNEDSADQIVRERSSGSGGIGVSGSHFLRHHRVMSDLEMSTIFTISGNSGWSSSRNEQEMPVSTDEYSSGPNGYCWIKQHSRYRRYVLGGMFVEGEINPEIIVSPYYRNYSQRVFFSEWSLDSNNNAIWRYSSARDTSTYRSLYITGNILGAIGSGWVAPVTSAAIVTHMIGRIAAVTGKRPSFTDDQKQRFASLLDRLLRRRVFDSRIAVIETLDSICTYLRSEKAIEQETSRLTMELHDIWAYGYRQERYSGKEIKCAPLLYASYKNYRSFSHHEAIDSIGPFDTRFDDINIEHASHRTHDSSRYGNYRTIYTYGARLQGMYSKPYGHRFELDGSAEFNGTLNTMIDSIDNEPWNQRFRGTYPNATGKANLTLRWFPSIRSTISFGNYFSISKDFAYTYRTMSGVAGTSLPDSSEKGLFIEANSGINLDYYISPRCSYYVSGELQFHRGVSRNGYSFSTPPVIKGMNFYFSGSLTYALF